MRRSQRWFEGMCALYALAWLWSSTSLPARVPTRFGSAGRVDQWSGRSGALLATALIGVGTAAFFAAVVWVVNHRGAAFVNIPNSSYWKRTEHLPRMRRLVTEDLWLFGSCTMLLLTAVQLLVLRASHMSQPDVGPWAGICVCLYLIALAVRAHWMYRHRYATSPA